MPLITDKIMQNAEKCKKCAFLKMRTAAVKNIHKTDVLFDEALISVEAFYRGTCTMCPFSEDFEKVFGMKPYDYYPPSKTPTTKKKKED